jgi:hypothetical protein
MTIQWSDQAERLLRKRHPHTVQTIKKDFARNLEVDTDTVQVLINKQPRYVTVVANDRFSVVWKRTPEQVIGNPAMAKIEVLAVVPTLFATNRDSTAIGNEVSAVVDVESMGAISLG